VFLGCLIIASYAQDPVRLACLIFASVTLALIVAVLAIAFIFKPELLRSERHEQVMRIIDIVGDSEMGDKDRSALISIVLDEERGRPGTSLGGPRD
jgi:hypothetical protein